MDLDENVVTEQDEARAEPTAQEQTAMEQANAGYARQKGARTAAKAAAPAPEPTPEPVTSEAPPAETQQEAAAEETPAPAPEANLSAAPDLTAAMTQLTDLKSVVNELAQHVKGSSAASEIRKLQGEIGSINRTLKQLSKSDDAPADLAAAIADVEKLSGEYPEVGGAMLKLAKAMQQAAANAPKPEEPATEVESDSTRTTATQVPAVAKTAEQFEQEAAVKYLNELHPDRKQIHAMPEFDQWLSKKPPEYQTRVKTSWNPAVLSGMYDEFKAFRSKKVEKQARLEATVTPKGTVVNPTPTSPTPEEAAMRGYQRYASKRL
jgi:hypothetical protein